MKNIYDIIAEQKSMVDFRISCFELSYLTEEFDYLEEGFVDGVKNMIKKIIAKIKETVNKAIDFLFGRKRTSNNNGGSSNGSKSTNSGTNNKPTNNGGKSDNDEPKLTPEQERKIEEQGKKSEQNMWNSFTKAVNEYDGKDKEVRTEISVSLQLPMDIMDVNEFKRRVNYIDSHNPSIWETHKNFDSVPPQDEWDDDYLSLIQADFSHNLSKERAKHIIEVMNHIKKTQLNNKINKSTNNNNQVQASNKTEVVKYTDPKDILKNSKITVKTFVPSPLQKKMDLANKFFSAVDSVTQQMKSMKFYDGGILVKTIVERTFKDRAKFKDQLVGGKGFMGMEDLEYLFNLNTGSEKDEVTTLISSLADKLIPYLNSDEAVNYLRAKEKNATDNLNKMIKILENVERQRGALSASNVNINDMSNAVRDASTLVANFIQIVCKSIVRCSSLATQLLEKAKSENK